MTVEKYKWTIERILFLATIIGWAVSVGIGISEFSQMRKAMEEMQKQLFEQQQLNGKIMLWMEIDLKEKE